MDDQVKRVVEAQSGNVDALESLLTQLRLVFTSFFVKRIGRRTEVEDLVQNTLVRLHRGLGNLKDPTKLRGFAMKAAIFELNDYFRGRYSIREKLFQTLPDHAGPREEVQLIRAWISNQLLQNFRPEPEKLSNFARPVTAMKKLLI